MASFQVLVRAAGAPSTLALNVESSETASQVVEKYAHATGRLSNNFRNRLVHCGNTLPETISLAEASIPPCALLEIIPRLQGGGGDGGSTGAESRSAYLAMYRGKQHDKVNPEEERLAKWTSCSISGMPLHPPCAADELGNLFNKEAVVQALLAKKVPRGLGHITSMKHLIDIKLEESQGTASDAAVHFACPVTGLPLSGKSKFLIIQGKEGGVGHVVSERALKELPMVVKEIVGGDWTPEHVLPVYPQGEDLGKRQEAVMAQRAAELADKLEKKAAKAAAKGSKSGINGNNKRSAAGTRAKVEDGGADGGRKGDGVGASSKRVRSAAEELMPSHADAKVWNSLFTNKEKEAEAAKGQKSKGNTDYMVRGQLKYVA